MHPFEFISTHSLASASGKHSPITIDEKIAHFITLSAHYMNLPAERLEQLKQLK